MEFDALKAKLEKVKHEQAKLAGAEQELIRQKNELIAALATYNLTPETVGVYLKNLKDELDTSEKEIDGVLKELEHVQ